MKMRIFLQLGQTLRFGQEYRLQVTLAVHDHRRLHHLQCSAGQKQKSGDDATSAIKAGHDMSSVGSIPPFVKFPQSFATLLVHSCWIGMTDHITAQNTMLQQHTRDVCRYKCIYYTVIYCNTDVIVTRFQDRNLIFVFSAFNERLN